MFDIVSFIPRAVVQGIPLLFGCTGETLTEKSGNLNLGIPGIMYVGGICGVIGAFAYEQSAGSAEAMNGFLAITIPLLCSRRRLRQLLRRLAHQAHRQRGSVHRPVRDERLL